MKYLFIKVYLILQFSCLTPVLSYALNSEGIDIEIQAEVHSSLQMQWHRLQASDQRYKTVKDKLALSEGWVLLPYGLYVEMQTNDSKRIISLHVENLTSTNKIDLISVEDIYISHNGKKPVTAKKDLTILDVSDHGLLKSHVLLFIIKTNERQKPGQYVANFKFVSNSLP